MRNLVNLVAFLILASCGQKRAKNNLQPSQVTCTSKIEIIESLDKYYFDTCIGSLENKTLSLAFQSNLNFKIPYNLKIILGKDSIYVISKMNYGVLDSSFRPTILTLLSKKIIFDNDPFEKNKIASGVIDLKFSAYHSWGKIFSDTVYMKGLFEAYIQ